MIDAIFFKKSFNTFRIFQSYLFHSNIVEGKKVIQSGVY